MERSIYLPLYGEIVHSEADNLSWDLYQTEALARLRDISLSSLPTRFAPHGSAASRFAHSVGVGYLARLLVETRPHLEPLRDTLIAAALCHDIGSPPFSHISEAFMFADSGKTHEEQTETLLTDGSEISQLLASYQVASGDVVDLILGRGIYGPLIAGSIDLDNIDNSLHLLTSIGAGQNYGYDPTRLIRAFVINQDGVAIDANYADQLISWDAVRLRLYSILQREEQLSSSTMLYRALEFAYAEGFLQRQFWMFEEGRALAHLRYDCGSETASLIDDLNRWRQYHLAYSQTSKKEDMRLAALYSDWRARHHLANEMADQLGIARHKLALYIGRDRGTKAIDLPFVGSRADEVAALFAEQKGNQRVHVYLAKEHLDKSKRLEPILTQLVNQLPEGPAGHSFF